MIGLSDYGQEQWLQVLFGLTTRPAGYWDGARALTSYWYVTATGTVASSAVGSFTLTTGTWHLDSLPVNQWPVTATLPAGCHRDPFDDDLLRIPPFPPDTVRYRINVICGS